MGGIEAQARMPLKTTVRVSSVIAQKKDFLVYVRAEIAKYFIFPWHFDPYLHLYLNQETSLKPLKHWV